MRGFLLVLMILTLWACNNDPIQYSFQGTVTDNTNNASMTDVAVTIYQKPFNNSVTSNSYEFAGSGTTDASGNYQIMFERKKVTEFKVTFTKSGYFPQEIILGSADVTSGSPNIVSTGLDAESWVKFNVQNVAPSNTTDNFTMIFFTYRTGCANCIENDYNYLDGIVDSVLTYQNTAGQYLKFTYVDVTGGQSTTDSLYMTPFDTVAYSILY
jgi:hypothetical protein